MLCEITIENVAVIEKATVIFGDGLNVLTGETGAGKSILIDSINAILGSRASRDLVRNNTSRACIWATFSNISNNVKQQLKNAGYEVEDELLLYREISAEGKSNCRINGMPVTASVLRDVCSNLIQIHGQHDNQSLMNASKHLQLLDTFAQNKKAHDDYYVVYRELCKVKREIDALSMDEDEKQKRMDLLQFQIDEINGAQLQDNEDEILHNRRNVMRNAKSITEKLNAAYYALNGGDDYAGAAEMIGDATNAIDSIANVSEDFAPLNERINDLFYTTRELASDIGGMLDSYVFDANELEEIEDRIDLIYKLKQKYGNSVEEILAYEQKATAELSSIQSSAEHLDVLYEQQADLYQKAKDLANILSKTRLDAFKKFNVQISQALKFLNMPGISFELQHKVGPLASAGQDSVEFYISTNKGEVAKPLAKIASGGELSRIMLALKSAMADKDDVPTVIYDEIDTGVSGLAAARIGEKLKQTSNGRQIICITHTAQIAAQADRHLLIQKNIKNERTYTEIHPITDEARIKELARMISGDKITDLSLANAREMLELSIK